MSRNNSYLMESPREANRLKRKVNPDAFVEKYLNPLLAELQRNAAKRPIRVLDVACGSGVITAAIAKSYPGIQVFGVDVSARRFAREKERYKTLSNLHFCEADAKDIPFDSQTFDLVFTRFLLEYMRRPQAVIKELVRLVRCKGILLLQDLDGQLITHYPMSASFARQCDVVLKFLGENGFDPFVGRKLFCFSRRAGLKKISVRMEPYHFYAGKIDAKNYSLWRTKLDIAMPHFIKALGTKSKAGLFRKRYLAYLSNDQTLTFSTVFTVVGYK